MNSGFPEKFQIKYYVLIVLLCLFFGPTGCRTPSDYRQEADTVVSDIIKAKQEEALGKTEPFSVERPSDILRRRLLTEQQLLYLSEASLGTDRLETIEHWPEKDYPPAGSSSEANIPIDPNKPLMISLLDALQIGAHNSDEYQTRKENVFREALDLDLERNAFRNIFSSTVGNLFSADSSGSDTIRGTQNSLDVGITRTLENGVDLTGALAVDLAHLLTQGGASSLGQQADMTISIPLLRGSGRHIVTEPLTQAERNVVYAIYEFERFKGTFAVDIAREYLNVLRQVDQVKNAENNYRSKIKLSRYSRRTADAGRLSEFQADQAVQSELSARNGWISAVERYKNQLDTFKNILGLPTDAQIEPDTNDLELFSSPAEDLIKEILQSEESKTTEGTPPADTDIELIPPSNEDAGPFEIDESVAIKLSLENRLDLQVTIGGVYDTQRQVVVRADALGAELTLLGNANYGEGRSISSATQDNTSLRFDDGRYSSLLTLDLPLERTRERNDYRKSLLDLERAVRSVQTLEDQIKLSVRRDLRSLLESRESLKIQARSVVVADKRVKSSNLFLEAGRAQIRDLLEAQDALLAARNSLTSAVITYRLTELILQSDMGVLQVDANGMWREFSPEVIDNVKK